MAINQDITMVRGDSESWDITITDSGTGLPISLLDMTGRKIWFTVKTQLTDTTYVFQKTSDAGGGITIQNPTSGIARVSILPTDTNKFSAPVTFKYDVQFKNNDGRITTMIVGSLLITADLTVEVV